MSGRSALGGLVLLLAAAVTAPGVEAADVAVQVLDRRFVSSTTSVVLGDVVTWTNGGVEPHTVTVDGGPFSSGHMPPGAVFAWTADTAGRFNYRCLYHGGMAGTLVVRDPNDPNPPPVAPTPPSPPPERPPEPRPERGQRDRAVAAPPGPIDDGFAPVNLPDVTVFDLANLTSVKGTIRLTGAASNPTGGPLKVEIQVNDGPWREAAGSDAWSYVWRTTDVSDGRHLLSVRASEGPRTSPLVWIPVEVKNAAAAAPEQAQANASGVVLVALGAAVAAWALARRR